MEPILKSNPNRFVCFPIVNQAIWNLYQESLSVFWTPKDLDLTQDVVDWETKLTAGQKDFLKPILAFFAVADGIVNENISANFGLEIQSIEHRYFYGFQLAMENIHGETYALLLQTFVKDVDERTVLFNSIETNPFIQKKAKFAFKYMDAAAPFGDRIIAFVCMEGIFFSASFCSIFYFKQLGLMPGLGKSNEFISRDEGLHTTFGCTLSNELKYPCLKIHEIVKEAVNLECEFVRDCIKVDLIGLNATTMCAYVEYVADRLLQDLNAPKLFNTKNPYPWMERISLDNKTNFFEQRPSTYNTGHELKRFKLEDDF